MRAARIALLLAGLVLAVPSGASADETIGAVPVPDTSPMNCQPGGCTVAQTTAVAPVDGVITRWRVRAGTRTTPVRLQIIRANAVVAESATVTPPSGLSTTYPTRLAIQQNDRIGLFCCASAEGDFIKQFPNIGTSDGWNPALDATPRPPTATGAPADTAVAADIERDADTDGYGDETQDNCPADANPTQTDTDGDDVGDACDSDDDGDGVPDATDDCDLVAGPSPQGCPLPPPLPPPPPNRAPTVRFRTPLAGTAIGPSFRIMLDVADDKGSPTVTVFDDDGTICVLRRAPYACTWTPTGADVGRATLLASAVDSAGLSTLGIVRVRVNRFEASLTQRQRHRKGVTRVTGRLVLPAAVTRAQGCSGTVRIRLRKARRTATLTRRCTYSARLPFRPGRARVSFSGNPVLAPT